MRYSRQREAVYNVLCSTDSHPDVAYVYSQVRKIIPSISLGTVYRNLNLLADIGEIIKIPTPDGGDRFDGRTDPHYHVVCGSCGNVFDLELDESFDRMIRETANQKFEGIIESHSLLFHGKCQNCCNKNHEKELK